MIIVSEKLFIYTKFFEDRCIMSYYLLVFFSCKLFLGDASVHPVLCTLFLEDTELVDTLSISK